MMVNPHPAAKKAKKQELWKSKIQKALTASGVGMSNAKSSKFNTVDTILFNIYETPKSVAGSSKRNGSNGDGEGSSKAIKSDGGDSGSGKRTIIDLDDYDEEEAKAKRVKKVV
ncbi:hypothetical protein Tco_0658048 [Tanacetum coccineum]